MPRECWKGGPLLDSIVDGLIVIHQLPELCRQDNVDKLTSRLPLLLILEHLSEDVRRHALAAFMSKNKLSGLVLLMNPSNLHTMCSLEVTHRRILAALDTLQHCLVILKEPHLRGMRQKILPKLQTRASDDTQRVASRN